MLCLSGGFVCMCVKRRLGAGKQLDLCKCCVLLGGIFLASVGGKTFAEVQPFTCNQLAYHTNLCRDVPGKRFT